MIRPTIRRGRGRVVRLAETIAWVARLVGTIAWLAAAGHAQAQEQPPSARLQRLPDTVAAPVLDGRLDDLAWEHATRLGPLRQVIPTEDGEPSEKTEVRILYDRRAIYVGVRATDREPDRIIANSMVRDGALTGDDRITILFDTFHDHRNAFLFSTNPNGARFDGLVENNIAFKTEWDGIWWARARRDAEGWTCEFEIPFKTLSFDPQGATWGFNLLRTVRRRNEENRWASARQNRFLIDVSEAGDLQGLTGLEQGVGLDVIPSGSTGFTHESGRDRSFGSFDPGLDVFYRITSSVTGALTLNTDFSDAAVDARQVNLSRFALFFPETRDFFLQDAGIFDFPVGDVNGTPFFSRRIGLDEDGGPVDLRAGVKATGRVGPVNFGFLDTQMAGHGDVDAKNLAAGRVKVNLGDESFFGLIATHGDPLRNGTNSLFGADLSLRTSHFDGDQVVEGRGWLQHSSTSEIGDDRAFGVQLSYPNDRWNGSLNLRQIGEDFEPALGFVNRTGIRSLTGSLRRRWRPEASRFRIVDTQLGAGLVLDLGNDLESLSLDPVWFRLENHAGDFLSLSSQWRTEVLEEPFEIARGILIETDRYDFGRTTLSVGSAASRRFSVQFDFGAGSFFSGHIRSGRALLEWRVSKHLFASVEYLQNSVRLQEGAFTTRLGRVRLNIVFTPDLSWETFLQFDNIGDSVGWNSRLRWILRPGRELVLVWNQAFDTTAGNFRGQRSNAVAKVRWTFRF